MAEIEKEHAFLIRKLRKEYYLLTGVEVFLLRKLGMKQRTVQDSVFLAFAAEPDHLFPHLINRGAIAVTDALVMKSLVARIADYNWIRTCVFSQFANVTHGTSILYVQGNRVMISTITIKTESYLPLSFQCFSTVLQLETRPQFPKYRRIL